MATRPNPLARSVADMPTEPVLTRPAERSGAEGGPQRRTDMLVPPADATLGKRAAVVRIPEP